MFKYIYVYVYVNIHKSVGIQIYRLIFIKKIWMSGRKDWMYCIKSTADFFSTVYQNY